jgi:hypothetical protein
LSRSNYRQEKPGEPGFFFVCVTGEELALDTTQDFYPTSVNPVGGPSIAVQPASIKSVLPLM